MTLLAILNAGNKEWWYHKQLRRQGRDNEARELERRGIRSDLSTLREYLTAAKVGRFDCYWAPGAGCYFAESFGKGWHEFGGYRHGAHMIAAMDRLNIPIRIRESAA